MKWWKSLKMLGLGWVALLVAAIPWGGDLAYGNTGPAGVTWYANSPSGGTSGPAIQKFVDTLPGLGSGGANNLGNFIPVATPDTTTFPGSDYYQIGEVNFTQRMNTNLPATTQFRGYKDLNPLAPANPNSSYYLGPVIVAQQNRPVRVKFTNQLANAGTPLLGNLFIPVDPTLMGAGMGPDGTNSFSQNRTAVHLHGGATPWISDGTPWQWFTPATDTTLTYKTGASYQNVPDMPNPGPGALTNYYTNQQSNRLMFYHDHAVGITRLNVYAGMAAGYLIHDPSEDALIAAGTIPTGGGAYNLNPLNLNNWGVPLVIQDKSFVPQDIATQDSQWNTAAWGGYGNLWFPHIYEPNQDVTNPANLGANPYGRWDYGPWVWPNITAPVNPNAPAQQAALPLPAPATTSAPWLYPTCAVPEAFMDTPVVNGCAYPYMVVQPQAYRFRILNACNDRYLNLQMYQADTGGGGTGATATATVAVSPGPITSITGGGGAGYTAAPGVYITGGGGSGATAAATLTPTTVASFTVSSGGSGYSATPTVTIVGGGATTPATATPVVVGGIITGLTLGSGGAGYTSNPTVVITDTTGSGAMATVTLAPTSVFGITLTNGGSGYSSTAVPPLTVTIASATALPPAPGTTVTTGEVKMVPAVPTAGYPSTWPTDGRDGGVPDPALAGPAFYQIGNEGGFLPQVALINPQPVNYDYNRRSVTITNVTDKALYVGPAERADVIIDFSQYAGKTIIVYNDAPAPMPGFDPRYDYYTGDPDQTASGGAPTTLPGYGPNTRTVMQFQVAAATPVPLNRAALENATTGLPAAYVATQPPPIVPETFYPPPYQAATDTFGYIQSQTLTYTPVGSTTPIVATPLSKAIIELFDTYGRMNATLGLEVTDWTSIPAASTGIGFPYIDPPGEIFKNGETQIWKITHNGVDTHVIHFHLVNVQLINRVGWDGSVRPPDPNERGWKETIRMNPLEVIFIAMKAKLPTVPFSVHQSIRPLNPSMPLGSTVGFSNIDPITGNPTTTPTVNQLYNFGFEYVWHCHILGHEENDMMRPFVVRPGAQPQLLLLQ